MAVLLVGCGSDSPAEAPHPDAGRDAATEVGRDLGPDLGPDAKRDLPSDPTWDPDIAVDLGPDTALDGRPDLAYDGPVLDGPTLDQSPLDGPGLDQSSLDGGRCPAGQVLRYTSAGCGGDVKPVCGSPVQDACAKSACSCSGKLIIGCDFFSEPWSKMTEPTSGCGLDGGTVDSSASEAGTVDSQT